MSDIKQKKENVKMHLKDLRQNLKKKKDKELPWWVELLFVKIGLPDKLIIKLLKAKKTYKEYIKNEKDKIFFTNPINCNFLKFL